jgi:two-component system chemotaxis response regulator CheB
VKKKILIVDDSALMRRTMCDIIDSDGTFRVADTCKDGIEAYQKLKVNRYDAVILDVNMPRMGGVELLERLHKEHIKATVILVSTTVTAESDITILGLEMGAVDFVSKPTNIIEARGEKFKNRLLSVLKTAVGVSNINYERHSDKPLLPSSGKVTLISNTSLARTGNKIVALACSTGGPKALQSVVPYLPMNLNAPMVIVQHMPGGFTKAMADRLNVISAIKVKEAEEGEILKKGTVYIAPGGKHLEIAKRKDGLHEFRFNDSPAVGGLKPCANITYESLCDSGYEQVICVVLTGMGLDGTEGIRALSHRKRVHVIAQDEPSCVVYGMPKGVVDGGLANEVVPLTDIFRSIIKNVGVQ